VKALTRAFLDHETKNAALAELPSLIGELARVQAEALARLASVQREDPADDEILTTEKMAERLRLPDWKVRELCRTKQLPARKLGAEWAISAGKLREWTKR
jgi:excisionase family DNA binding protein